MISVFVKREMGVYMIDLSREICRPVESKNKDTFIHVKLYNCIVHAIFAVLSMIFSNTAEDAIVQLLTKSEKILKLG